MAQTGNFSPIQLYSSSTPGNAPAVGNLVNSTLGSELAINIADGKLFYKDSGNAIQVIGWKTTPTTAGGTGLTSYTAGDMVYWASGTTFTKLGIGASNYIMTSSGSAPQWSASIGPAQGGTGITSYAVGDLIYASGTTTLSKLADVATGNALISGGVGVAPSWGKIDLTTTITGTLPVGNGGTGQTTFTSGQLLFGNGTSGLNANANFAVSAAKLTVLAGTSQQPMIQIQANSAAAGGFNRAFFKLRDSTGTNGWDIVEYGDDSNSLTFESYAASVGTEIVKLTSSGTFTLNGVSTAKSFVPTSNSAPSNGMYLPGTNILGFVSNSTERMRLPSAGGLQVVNCVSVGNAAPSTSGAGVTFPATQSASSDANTLDDYEEGTFTISLLADSGSITLNASTMLYTKVGRLVTCTGYITVSSVSSPAGTLYFTGLPFTSNSASPTGITGFSVSGAGWGANAATQMYGYIDNNGTTGAIGGITVSTGANVPFATYINSSTFLRISMTYMTS